MIVTHHQSHPTRGPHPVKNCEICLCDVMLPPLQPTHLLPALLLPCRGGMQQCCGNIQKAKSFLRFVRQESS